MTGRAAKPLRATRAELMAIPEEERFHELIDGELVVKASPRGSTATRSPG